MQTLSDEEQQRLFRRFIADSPDLALFLVDRHGHVLTWNPGAERILGYAPHDIIGKHIRTFYTEEDRHAGVPEQELTTAAHEGRASDDRWLVRRDGRPVWVAGVTGAIKDGNAVVAFGKAVRDQTTLRQQHEEIQRLNADLQGKVMEMEDFEQMIVGRELRMMELKRENERLKERLAELNAQREP